MKKVSPIKFAKKVGVNFGVNFNIYGKIEWGTEPWIITIGNNVYLTDGIKFLTHDGGTLLFRSSVPDLEITKPIKIGNNVYIGNNVILLPGISIGDNCIIGAGSVVSKSIPSNCVAAGVPASKIKTIDEYFNKISNESLHVGNLKGKKKDDELKKIYGYNKKNSIY